MQFFFAATVVEKGITPAEYRYTQVDVIFSSIFADVVAFFIVVCTGATLFPAGIRVDSAADAAKALVPFAGPYAEILFAIGFIGASLLAASVLPLATAYALGEAFGFERGISHGFDEAPVFLGIYTAMIVLGAAFVLLPGVPLVTILIVSQFMDGLLLPILLIAITLLSNRKSLLGEQVNSRWFNIVAWVTTIGIVVLSVLLVLDSIFPTLF
jgi:Mn2+/Fe2+ NRAMP family transporter